MKLKIQELLAYMVYDALQTDITRQTYNLTPEERVNVIDNFNNVYSNTPLYNYVKSAENSDWKIGDRHREEKGANIYQLYVYDNTQKTLKSEFFDYTTGEQYNG